MKTIFFDGQFVEEDHAILPVNDRGFLYGDGVFTTIKVENGKVPFLKDHFERIQKHSEQLGIKSPQLKEEEIRELIRKNQAENGTWRLKIIVTGGRMTELSLKQRDYGHLVMLLKPYTPIESPLSLTLFPYPLYSPIASIKSLAYLDRLWIKDYAFRKGYEDALSITVEGIILETAFCNIFWRIENTLWTPHPNLPILYGISLEYLVKAMEALHFHAYSVHAHLEDIPDHAQVYLINSMYDIRAVTAIDERSFQRDLAFESTMLEAYRQMKKEHYFDSDSKEF